MNKDEFIRMQQAATNRVREMQKKAMQNNEKHDKNTNTQKDIQNNKKATKSAWSDGSSITLNNTALSTKKDQTVCCKCPANRGLFSNLSGQNDRLLLLGIIILLMGDNVDELLILALIYVML